MSIEKSFGNRLRELRMEKKLTQRELAEKVAVRLKDEGKGFDVTYLSKIENARLDPPSTAAIIQLAAVLNSDSDELLALAGKAPPDIGKSLQQSHGARIFYRSTKGATEEEWKKLLQAYEQMKAKK